MQGRPRQLEGYGTFIGVPTPSNANKICRLAFVEEPFPDELLGPWLARLSVLNGIRSARRFFELFGEKRQIHMYDLTDITGRADHLIQAAQILGVSSEVALRELSFRPYRACFESDLSDGGAARERFRSYHRRKFLRVCPLCLREDAGELGYPYVHRSHQLDGSHVCHKHGVDLRAFCPSCRTPIYTTNDFAIPPLRCHCGHRHTSGCQKRRVADPWWRLAKFEADCLTLTAGSLPITHVALALKDLLRTESCPGHADFRQALLGTFGERGLALLQNPLSDPTQELPAAKRLVGLQQETPTIICALFVALGCDAAAALSKIPRSKVRDAVQATPTPPRPKSNSVWRAPRPKEVHEARSMLKRALADGRVHKTWEVRIRLLFAYWLLRMRDSDWLAAQSPPSRKGSELVKKIPSIQADRNMLLKRPITSVMHYQDARVRAYYRDHRWLASQMWVPALQTQAVPPKEISASKGLPTSVAQAKRHLSTLLKSGEVRTRRQLRRRRRLLFWYLAIKDHKWLSSRIKRWGNTTDMIVVPTVTQDRRLVTAKNASGDHLTEALIRARIRDHAWFIEHQGRRLKDEGAIEVQRLLTKLKEARQTYFDGPYQSRRWTAHSASRLIGINAKYLYDIAAREPEVRAVLQATPEDYARRRARLQATSRECENEGPNPIPG